MYNFSTQYAECAPWRKLPQGGLTQARRKAKRQGDLITILTPDVPLTPIPTGVAGPLSEDIVRFVLGRSSLSFKKKIICIIIIYV